MRVSVRKINFLFIVLSFLGFRCSDSKENSVTGEKGVKTDSLMNKSASPLKDRLPSKYFLDSLKSERNRYTVDLLKKIKTVTVLSIEKSNSRIASTGEDLGEQCDKWHLDKSSIGKIFKLSKPISGPEWHYLYDVWPCDMGGRILINKDTFSFEVNPGSYMVIWNNDSSYYYGCTDKRLKEYFLSEVWDGKE